jgi:ribA/ribD-fused uncharacterized protein
MPSRFTNFSPHEIRFGADVYPSAEHLFQAHKFLGGRPELVARIRACRTPREALAEATRLRRFARPDWLDIEVAVMDNVLAAKFEQHPDLRDMLRRTGTRELVGDSPVRARGARISLRLILIAPAGGRVLGRWEGQRRPQ